jgi:hypothetical protein
MSWSPVLEDRWVKTQIERVLAAELSKAEAEARRARLHLREIMDKVPSGIPAPDSNLRITDAGQECKRAHAAWQRALERWTAFVRDGTVPEELKDSDSAEQPPKTLAKNG